MRRRPTNNPRLSVRILAAIVQMSRAGVHCTLLDLKPHPYHFSAQHELKLTDYTHHYEFFQRFIRFIRNRSDTSDNWVYSDKDWIHLNRYINSQDYHLWASENPNAFVEKGLCSQKVDMWYAVSRKQVVGPFSFRETINAD